MVRRPSLGGASRGLGVLELRDVRCRSWVNGLGELGVDVLSRRFDGYEEVGVNEALLSAGLSASCIVNGQTGQRSL
jgi:hypothetical protein